MYQGKGRRRWWWIQFLNQSVEIIGKILYQTDLDLARIEGRRGYSAIMEKTPPSREIFHGCAPPTDRDREKRRLTHLACLNRCICCEQSALVCAWRSELVWKKQPGQCWHGCKIDPVSRRHQTRVQGSGITDLCQSVLDIICVQIKCEIADRIDFLKEMGGHPMIEMEIKIRQHELARMSWCSRMFDGEVITVCIYINHWRFTRNKAVDQAWFR